MDQFVRRLFRDEIEMQCKFVLLGAVRLDEAETELSAPPPTKEEWMAGKRRNPEPNTGVWLALQDILVSAANISKLLWGSQGRRSAEREDLRSLLRISELSPLRSPDLRNDFEHFDERIERHFSGEKHNVYSGRNIGASILVLEDVRNFGHYEPLTGVVTFWENSVSLADIIVEAQLVLWTIEDQRPWPSAFVP